MSSDHVQRHWEDVYGAKSPEAVGWYQERPEISLALIAASGVGARARIVDIGGGASRLVDGLLDDGFLDVSVLDISAEALAHARRRLGPRADPVAWVVADVAAWRPPEAFDLWHDRAVFHFLCAEADRRAYRATLEAALAPGGHAVIATFAADGPRKCSGLPVSRYDPEQLAAAFAGLLELVESRREEHRTPAGAVQAFTWCRFRRRG